MLKIFQKVKNAFHSKKHHPPLPAQLDTTATFQQPAPIQDQTELQTAHQATQEQEQNLRPAEVASTPKPAIESNPAPQEDNQLAKPHKHHKRKHHSKRGAKMASNDEQKEHADLPVRKRRKKITARKAVPDPVDHDIIILSGTLQAPVQANHQEALQEKAKEVVSALNEQVVEAPLPTNFSSMIEKRAGEIRSRTHRNLAVYEAQGLDTFQLGDRPLKSVFEDDEGKPLPVGQRHEIMRDLQQGKIKRHWR